MSAVPETNASSPRHLITTPRTPATGHPDISTDVFPFPTKEKNRINEEKKAFDASDKREKRKEENGSDNKGESGSIDPFDDQWFTEALFETGGELLIEALGKVPPGRIRKTIHAAEKEINFNNDGGKNINDGESNNGDGKSDTESDGEESGEESDDGDGAFRPWGHFESGRGNNKRKGNDDNDTAGQHGGCQSESGCQQWERCCACCFSRAAELVTACGETERCDGMCSGCVDTAIATQIEGRVFGSAPVTCPGTCRQKVPFKTWSKAVPGREDGRSIAAFETAAARVVSFRCPMCDSISSLIEPEAALPFPTREDRLALVSNLRERITAKSNDDGTVFKTIARLTRGFARYETSARELGGAIYNAVLNTRNNNRRNNNNNGGRVIKDESLTWSREQPDHWEARVIAWSLLRLCPDAERRSSLLLGLLFYEPRVSIESCCGDVVCTRCVCGNPHFDIPCRENQAHYQWENEVPGEGGVRGCPACGVKLHKAEGCSSVVCPACDHAFDWDGDRENVSPAE